MFFSSINTLGTDFSELKAQTWGEEIQNDKKIDYVCFFFFAFLLKMCLRQFTANTEQFVFLPYSRKLVFELPSLLMATQV